MTTDVIRLFHRTHHSVTENELLPINKVAHIVDPDNHLGYYFQENIKYIYYCPNSFPKFVYWNEFVWIDVWDNSIESLQQSQIKEMIIQFKHRIDTFKIDNDYQSIFNLIAKKALFMLFYKYYDDIPVKDRYTIFRYLYRRSEYGFDQINPSLWSDLINLRKHSNEWKKSMKLFREQYKDLNIITVYRGQNSSSSPLQQAWSWTLSYDTAYFFATRFSTEGVIYEAKVNTEYILDYLPDSNEEEVLISPTNIQIANIETVYT